jgi:signal transduction histidine kinase
MDGSQSRQLMHRLLPALRQQDWLALTLLALHAALVLGMGTAVSKAFLLTHFGCFLLWQPVWRGEQKLYPGQAILILGAAAVLVAAESWWMIALWIAGLFALIGGEVPGIKNVGQRIVAMLAAVYLLSILLIWVVPHLFEAADYGALFLGVARYGPLLPLLLIFPVKTDRGPRASHYTVDLIYSLLLFLMVVVLVLGAFVIRQLSHGDYAIALAQALLVIAGILFALSWLWDPRGGFAGLGQLMNRYLMSVGMPFERWMHSLANLADQERDPDRFVMLAAQDMAGFPWVSGIDWQTQQQRGSEGRIARHATDCRFGGLRLTLYTRWLPSPALVLHIRLLARLLADYYEAKTREQDQRRNAYMHAIYETGSRLTHDVKNLLQSLSSLCAAVESSEEADAAALRRLVLRQLPQINQRLQGTLEKLNRRADTAPELGDAGQWWRELQQRFAHERIEFEAGDVLAGTRVPLDLFDRVAENCLQNALEKRRASQAFSITVRFDGGAAAWLRVCDAGDPLPEAAASALFTAPVPSHQGLGVGLYQAARQAAALGYELRLVTNEAGRVCFELRQAPLKAASPQPPVA